MSTVKRTVGESNASFEVWVDSDRAAFARLNREPDCWEVKRLKVEEKYEHQGYGKALLAELKSWADEHSYTVVSYTTANAAHTLYQGAGFTWVVDDEEEDEEKQEYYVWPPRP